MRVIARTGRSSAVSLGPFSLLIYAIGLFFYAALIVLAFIATVLVTATIWTYQWARKRSRRPTATVTS